MSSQRRRMPTCKMPYMPAWTLVSRLSPAQPSTLALARAVPLRMWASRKPSAEPWRAEGLSQQTQRRHSRCCPMHKPLYSRHFTQSVHGSRTHKVVIPETLMPHLCNSPVFQKICLNATC